MKHFSRQRKSDHFFPFVIFFFLLLIANGTANAQGSWNLAMPVDGAGTVGPETGRGICTDAIGNVYTVGVFTSSSGQTDFDLSGSSSASSLFTSAGSDGYVAKYDKNGVFQWKVVIGNVGNDFGSPSDAICTNGTYVWFTGAVNMGGGSAQVSSNSNTVTVTASTSNGVDAIVGKLNCGNGSVVWATAYGAAGADNSQGICIDPNGCCYTIGAYSVAFTCGTFNAAATNGGSDLYIAKFSASGAMIRFAHGGTTGSEMTATGAGLCYVPGATPKIVAVGSNNNGTTADYGGHGVSCSGLNDGVLLQLDSQLVFSNAFAAISTAGADEVMGVTYDSFSGDVFMIGYASAGSVTVPTSPSATTLTLAGAQDIIVIRYSPSGQTLTWAKSGGGAGLETPGGIASDGHGGIIITGYTQSSPASFGSVILPNTTGGDDIFVVRYSLLGTPMWGVAAGGTGADQARGISSYVETSPVYTQSLYLTGNFQFTATFGGQTPLVCDGATVNNDFFLARVNDLSLPLAATQSQVNLTCNGVCTGSATVVASGGTTPYTYSWSPSGGSGATASTLCATNYTVTITDAASTSITKTFNLTQPPAITHSVVTSTNVSCFGGSNGSATITAAGGTGSLTYNWTPGTPPGDGTVSVTGLNQNTWTCTITDANSCSTTQTVSITQPSTPVSGTTVVTNVSCFGGNNGSINLTPSGGSGGYTFNWLPSGPTTEDRTGLTFGTYTVQITDASGCTGTVTATVTQPSTPVSGTTVVTNVSCFGGSNGAITLSPTGGAGGYTYNWLPSGPTTQNRTGLIAGTYSVQITDVNGCTGTVTATVTQPTSPVSGTTVVTNVSCFGGSNGAINLTPTGGFGSGYTFNWLPSGPTTEDRTGLIAGTYSVQITDPNGCTGTVTATVTQPTSPVSGTTVVTNVSCFGGSNGAITLTPTGGAGGYTYNWLPSGPTTQNRTGLIAGTYSVQITDVNGCTGTVTATVTQPTSPVSGTTVVTNVSCFGGSNGAINLTPTGGFGSGYTFNWLPSGPTTEDRTGLIAGTYSVQITDPNGCTGTVTATVTQPTSPVSGTTVVTNVSCFGGSNGAITLTPTGGAGGYTYNWLPSGPTTQNRTGLIAGTYSVQITDMNGCTGTVTATVTQPTSPVSGTTVVTNVSCFGGSNGAINLTPTGGFGSGYTFNWLPSGPTTEDRTGLIAGTYSVQITDPNGCTGTVTATVTQPTSPVSGTTVVTNVSCFGGSNGAITLTPTGGAGGYTYNWLPSGPTTQNRTGLIAGTYSVQITDMNGCTGTVTATVTQPTSPVSGTTVVTNVSCFGGSNGAINLTPTGGFGSGYTFNWLPSGPTTEDRTGLIAGTYSVQITDPNGCTGTVTATVTQPTSPVSGTTVVTSVSCFGGSNGTINLTPTGGFGSGYTFNWLPSGPTTEDRTGLIAGTYSVQITDPNGCTGTVTATVTQPTSPVSGTTVVTSVSCFGGSNGTINLTPTGGSSGYTFNWLPSGPTTEDRTGLIAGTYSVQITDVNGCTGTVTATVTQPTSPVSGTTVVTNVACFGGNTGAINLTPTGGSPGYTFNWLPSGPTTEDRTGLIAGTYSVQITDANGCTGTVTATVTQPTSPVSGTTVVTNVSCFGGSNGAITLTPTGGAGGYTYNWLPSGPTTQNRTGLTAGTYSVQITDVNGCTGTVTATVTQPSTPVSGTTVVTSVSCFGGSNGAIDLTPTGGAGSYTYNWLPSGPTTQDRTGLIAGTYSVQVTDMNGCTGTVTATVTQPTAPVSGTTVVTNVSCFGGSNGAIDLTPTGGSGGYTYNWLPSGPTTQDRTGLTSGTYSVQITDANACTGTVTATVTQPTAPVSGTTVVTNVSCFGGNNGAIDLTPTGGSGGYTYNWLPSGPTTQDRTGLTAGTYSVQITDVNSCTGTVTATVTSPSAISVTASSQTNISCFGGSTGAAAINTPTGGASGYTYNWTPGNPTGDGTISVTGLTAASWTCTVTDANGCTASQVFNVTSPTAITSSVVSQTNVSCFGGNNGAATINASNGTPGYTYSWSPAPGAGQGTISVTGLTAQLYTCTITDANGCTKTQTVNITEPPVLIVASFTQTNILCNGSPTGSASVVISGGTIPYSYDWTPGNPNGDGTPGVMNLTAGSWTCTVTDNHGCTTSHTFIIVEPIALNTGATQTDVTCSGNADGSATVMPSGGVGSYTYSWSPIGGTSATASNLPSGLFTCTITDANGCTISQGFNITEPTPVVSSNMQTNVSCNGGNNGDAMVMVSGGTAPYTYSWSPSGGSGSMAMGLNAGTFDCTITDFNGCTLIQSFNITEPSPLFSIPSHTNTTCFGGNDGSAGVTVSGGAGSYTYSWSPSGGTASTATGLSAGPYVCTITDANNCTMNTSITIAEPTQVIASALSGTILCNGGSTTVTVSATGGTSPYTGTGTFTENAGTYTYPVSDNNGCPATASVTVTEPTAIAVSSTSTDVSCFGGSNGAIDLTVTGGTMPYTFDWNSGTYSTEDLSGLSAGTYIGTLTDANGCTDGGTIVINEPSALVVSLTGFTNPSTCGGTDGSVDISVSGGTAAYSYLWNTSATSEDLSGIGAGAYNCTITDANGCTGTANANLNDPNAPTVTLALTIDTVCQTTTAPFVLSGGSPAGGTFSGTGVSAGTFDPMSATIGYNLISYTYTDISGCTGSTVDSIYVDICMGIASAEITDNFTVMPNPNNGTFMLSLNTTQSADVIIYDAMGQLISKHKVQAHAEQQLTIESSGLYMVTVVTQDGHRTTKRVVVNK